MTQLHQRNRHPKYRKKYEIRNWRSYERSLINRGDLTLWLSEDVIQSWNRDLDQRMGRPKLYSDLAIETALTLRLFFKLPLRQTEGFLKSSFRHQHAKSIDEDGVLPWKRTSGDYRQSEVENMFFRYKNLIGDELKARNENSRRVESVIACNILNQFRLLGSPQSKLVA